MSQVLRVENLRTTFRIYGGTVYPLDEVTFAIREGETLGMVGETGSGKSVTALSIMRLIEPPGEIVGGQVLLEGEDLLAKSEEEMRKIRGSKIAMIFQDPMTSLDPVYRIGNQIVEVLMLHQQMDRNKALERAVELLAAVGIPSPGRVSRMYPHEASGGIKQRAMIAMALSCQPRLLIADEPTTALDVTVEAQIIELMRRLKNETKSSILFITHNLGVVAQFCDKVIVMYAGSVVESAPVSDLFSSPLHPYTKGLLESIPRIDRKRRLLPIIQGNVPSMTNPPSGCRFHPRCPHAMPRCKIKKPVLNEAQPAHFVSCFLFDEESKP
ncbi:MAG: ABC transporter ATP-binding protein [Candidatus Bathyarchaeia archaeon]|jgi:oligopeptide/dipeptide ABC transporter ATP-binding protein